MLKLEKSAKSKDITIALKAKESFYSRTFIAALMIAVVIHLLAFTVLKIAVIHLDFPDLHFPPVTVIADLQREEQNTVSIEFADLRSHTKNDLEPLVPPIELPLFEQSHKPLSPELFQESDTKGLFLALEQPITLSFSEALAPPITYPKVEINYSGPLGERDLVSVDRGNNEGVVVLPSSKVEQYRLDYDVLVEAATGHVIWFNPVGKETHRALSSEAQKMLKSFQFAKSDHDLVIPGYVEIVFTMPVKSPSESNP